MNYKLYIIFYYIYVLILVEKLKEQPKGRMEEPGKEMEAGKGMEPGKDRGKDSESPTTTPTTASTVSTSTTTTTTSSSVSVATTATNTPASCSPPPHRLSGPPSTHAEYREWVVDKVAEKAASEEKERERERLVEWTPHGSQEMQEGAASDDGPCASGLEASIGNSGKLKCIFG